MQEQPVATPSAQFPILVPQKFELTDKQLAVSHLLSPRMTELVRTLSMSMKELEVGMRLSGNPRKNELLNASMDIQLKEIAAEFRKATLMPQEFLVFLTQVLSRIKSHYDSKDFSDEDFRIHYHACVEVRDGEDLRPLPPCMQPFAETSFYIHGVSGMGRSVFLQRIGNLLGGPFVARGEHPVPAAVIVTPHLIVRYPSDGKLATLFQDLRQTILVGLRDHRIKANALSQLLGTRGKKKGDPANVAIALCILMNVGLFILDGGSWQHVNKKTSSIFNFLLKLREFSGIPILVSGTSAFIHSATFMHSINGPLFNGPNMYIGMFPPPPPVPKTPSPEDKGASMWRKFVIFFWKQGFIPAECEMPVEFPEWLHKLTLGNLRWLKQGFEAFHVAMVTDTALRKDGALTEEKVSEIFKAALMTQQSTLDALVKIGLGMRATTKDTLHVLRNMDYLPLLAFDTEAVNDIVAPLFYAKV